MVRMPDISTILQLLRAAKIEVDDSMPSVAFADDGRPSTKFVDEFIAWQMELSVIRRKLDLAALIDDRFRATAIPTVERR